MSQKPNLSSRQGPTAEGPEDHRESQKVFDLEGKVRRGTKLYLVHKRLLLDNKLLKTCWVSAQPPLQIQCVEIWVKW